MNEQKELHFPTVAEEIKSFEPKEKTMTTKELADAFGVGLTTVKNAVEKLRQNIGEVKTNTQGGYLFTEKQATAIKIELQNHSKIANNGYNTLSISNDLECFELQKRLDVYKDKRIAELQSQVATLKPQAQIANDFIDRNHLTNFRDASNILKIKQSDFMKILAEKYVYKNSIGEYRCYAEYEKYFSLRPFQKGIEKTGQQLMLTLDGLEFFKNKIFTEVEA